MLSWRPGEDIWAKAPVLSAGPTKGLGCLVTVLGFQIGVQKLWGPEGETGADDVGKASESSV